MGGGKSSSSSTQTTNKTTNIRETTSTKVGDIGFTGAQAVAFADAIGAASILSQQNAGDISKTLIQETGKAAQHLVAGSTELVKESKGAAETMQATIGKVAEQAGGKVDTGTMFKFAVLATGAFVAVRMIGGKS